MVATGVRWVGVPRRLLVIVLLLAASPALAQLERGLQVPESVAMRGDAPATLEVRLHNPEREARTFEVRVRSVDGPAIISAPDPATTMVAAGGTGAVSLEVRLSARPPGPTAFALEVGARSVGSGAATEETARVRATWAPERAWPASLATAGEVIVGLGALAAAGVLAARAWGAQAFGWPLAVLYTRIRPSRVLDHPARRKLYTTIAARPGLTYTELQDATRLSTGALQHHLRILVLHGLVRDLRESGHRRLALTSAPPPEPSLSRAQRRVLQALPPDGLPQREVARRIGITRQGAGWHLRRLAALGFVESDLVAGERRWRPVVER
jgi:DNA-binding MarR family transcriptional regulator